MRNRLESLCKYSSRCEIYQKALGNMKSGEYTEDDHIQVVEVCGTDHRFFESCYKQFSGVELASSEQRHN